MNEVSLVHLWCIHTTDSTSPKALYIHVHTIMYMYSTTVDKCVRVKVQLHIFMRWKRKNLNQDLVEFFG